MSSVLSEESVLPFETDVSVFIGVEDGALQHLENNSTYSILASMK